MKSIQNQYIDLQEGRMTQANFMKNVRQSLPQFISNIVSFKDSVRILKNKGILSESLETACDTCGKPMDENEEGDAIDWYDYQVDDVDSEEIEGGFGANRPKYTYNAFGTAFGRDIDGTEYKAKFSGKMIKGELDDDSIKIDFDTIELDEAITDNEIYEHVDYESIKSIHHKLADILEKNGKISRSDMLSVAKEFNIDPTSSDFGTIIRKVSELNNPKPAEEEMDESKEQYSPSGINLAYTHFAVKKDDNKIVDAWDYKGVDNEEIKYYSKQDLKDNDYNYPKDIKIVTKSFLERNQIDPFDSKNWFKHKAELNEAKEKQPKEIKGSSGKEQYSKFTEAELDNYQELITGIHTEHICNPDKTYEEISKMVLKNIKKNPHYYTNYKLTGIRDYKMETMDKSKPEDHQMKYLDKDNIIDKARGMKPVTDVSKPKADANKNKKETVEGQPTDLMSLIAKTIRGMDKMAPTGEKMKKVTIKESNLREKLADMIRKEVREAMGVMGGDNMNGDDEDFHNQNISAGPTL